MTVVCERHNRSVADLCYGPVTPDGVLLLTASEDHTAILRNGETGGFIHKFEGHEGQVWSCDINSMGRLAATASEDCTVRIWDINARQCVHKFSEGNIMQSCAFSLVGNYIVMGGFRDNLKLYDLHQVDTPIWQIANLDACVRSVAWMDDHRLMVSFSDKVGFRVWDIRGPPCIKEIRTHSSVTSIELHQSKNYITTMSANTATIWNLTFNPLVELCVPRISESASFRPQNDILIVGGDDRVVRILGVKDRTEISVGGGFHMGPIQCVRFSPNGQSFAAGSRDGRTIIRKIDIQMEDVND
ncbi:serine-threonine kinase receptor-associated protein isoform X2 [Rosa chinensis]|uniref:serine-threonine kinase receptor-associated protein isoform X2 n=1 Tax=Rosa chinensis TaxID=74649 RepID=UPI001AD8BE32|nr:serine-threonine kinase receptor-associated protein isoform X2 [Rosa chinensis]